MLLYTLQLEHSCLQRVYTVLRLHTHVDNNVNMMFAYKVFEYNCDLKKCIELWANRFLYTKDEK
jgi:hypothetical protein